MRVAGDIEANDLLEGIHTIWCGVYYDLDSEQSWKFRPHEMREHCEFLSRCSVVCYHNGLDYDVPALKKVLGFDFTKSTFIIDTYLLSQMLTPDRKKHPQLKGQAGGHGLANFGLIFGVPKPEHEQWDKFDEDMLHRCDQDALITKLTFQMLNRTADIFNTNSVWYKPYLLEAAFAKCLVDQKAKGFLVDQEKIQTHIDFLTDQIDTIDREVIPLLPKRRIINETKKDGSVWNKKPFKGNGELNQRTINWCDSNGISDRGYIIGPFTRVAFDDFDLGSVKQVKDYLLGQGWIPDQWNYKEDPVTREKRRTSPKLSKTDPFVGVTGDIGKRVADRMVYRHRRSQLEGFQRLVRSDGRITAGATGITPTCRLKHSGVVNIPGEKAVFGKEMRSVFTVPQGYDLVGCDAAACQLRDLAHYMGDDAYTSAVIEGNREEGTDIHTVNQHLTDLPTRDHAKTWMYAFIFGASDTKLASIMGLNVSVARRARRMFLERLPKFKAVLDRAELEYRQKEYIVGLDGRPLYPRSPHECLAYLLQGAEAIMMKVATCYAIKWIEQEGLDSHMVCHMHDEFQFETLKKDSKRVGELLERSIVKAGEYLKMNVPMAGEAAIGIDWSQTH